MKTGTLATMAIVWTPEILRFMRGLDVKEIHGYRRELGLRVFTAAALDGRRAATERLAAE